MAESHHDSLPPFVPSPPEGIADEALLEWHRICDELASIGMLETADRSLLTMYVQAWATNQAATAIVAAHGAVKTYSNGVEGPSPAYKVQLATTAQIRRLLTDMGITPAMRAKLRAAKTADKASTADLEV